MPLKVPDTEAGWQWWGRCWGHVLAGAGVKPEGLQLRKIAFLDGVFEEQAGAEDKGGFDSDVAIATGELAALITDLSVALGGELL